ncbi:MAG: DUF922 domain-containing protein [Rhodanobacter sp.]
MFAIPPPQTPAALAPVVREDVRYYVIEGRSEPELVAQMNAMGYLTEQGRYWGHTSSRLGWSFDTKAVAGRCNLVGPNVSLTITTVLPQWTPPPGTPETVVGKWHALTKALHHHEGEHAQIARAQAQALMALMLRHHSDHKSCAALDASVQAEGRAIMHKSEAADVELDRRTVHGATEGVSIQW